VWGPRMRRRDDSKWPASLLCATRPTKCGESSEEQQVLRNPMQAFPLDANQDELDLSGPGFTKPVGTGPARFQFGPVSNWSKFKIQI